MANHKLSGLFVAIRNELARSVLKIVPPDMVEDIVQEAYVRLCQVGDQDLIHHPSPDYSRVPSLSVIYPMF
jgi:hypothetical protein